MLLSVVIVAHRQQAWIRLCLRSMLDQLPADAEVVVVDDASGDHTPRIVTEAAGGDSRVRLQVGEARLGAALARARALDLTTGDYVWFLDPTSLVLPGALARVTAALGALPDVVLVAENVLGLYGGERPRSEPPGTLPVLRDRLVRRGHLLVAADESGGGYAEPSLATAVLARADAVATLDEAVTAVRDLPARVLRQWAAEGALPRRTESSGTPASPAPTARARRVARLLRRAVKKTPRSRKALRNKGMQGYYALQRRRPLQGDLAVYTAYWGSAYSCNPRAIYEKARELAPGIRGVWVMKAGSEGVLPAGVPHVTEGSRDYYRLMACATWFVNNANFANDVVKRPGQVHLQTHHGTPLKTMGLDLVHAPHSSMGLNFPRLMRRVARWDYSVSANEFSTEIWERVYPSGTYRSLETGYPRNDVLVTATAEHRDRVRAELGIAPGQLAVLYTPTHREYTKEYVPLLDVSRLAEDLAAHGADVVLLMRTHYFYGPGEVEGADANVRDVAAYPSIEDLAIGSDVLVTDYSSLMFDYAVLERPIVVYAPDWETYRRERGTYFDLLAEPPGAVAVTQEELTEVLRSGVYADEASTAALRSFRARFCALEDGRAAERVVRALWPVR